MKRKILILLILHFSLFTLHSQSVEPIECVVYSPASSSPLHVSTIPNNAADVSVSRAFPSSYTGHRSVCTLPATCEDHMLEGWTGGIAYEPGSPYGIALTNQNVIGLTTASPITPRINLVSVQSDRPMTFDQIREDIRARLPPLERAWIDKNVITPATIEGNSFKGQRIRVVRWLVNDVPVHRAGTDARVVLDKKIKTDVRDILTEADFLVGSGAFDLDWADLNREVISNPGTISALGGEEVRRVCYLIVVGDGAPGWEFDSSTNEVVALSSVITRYYGERRVKPFLTSATARDGRVTIRWCMDCPFEEGYTAFRIVVTSGGSAVFDSGKFYATPTNGRNLYSHTLDHTFNAGTYDWKIAAFNAKYSQDTSSYYTNGVPFTVTVE